MSRQITQPLNQVRLTNVAVVRMNKNGKRFEVACYRNKIVNYRQGIESDLSEVLQTDRVFTNVSKGEFAKSSDLKKAFGTSNEEEICRLVLQKGQIQISDMERCAFLENTLREIAVMISEKCMNPQSNRPYTVDTIRNAMKEAEFNVHPTKNVKQQFLDCVKLLAAKNVIPIVRAKMHLCSIIISTHEANVRNELIEAGVHFVKPPTSTTSPATTTTTHDYSRTKTGEEETRLEFVIDPSLYRKVDEIIKNEKRGRLEIVKQNVFEESDFDLDSELARKDKLKVAAAVAAEQMTEMHCFREQDSAALSQNTDDLDDTEKEIMSVTSSTRALNLSKQETHYEADEKCETDEEELTHYSTSNESAQQSHTKAQKKSKKAKRREKEDAEDRGKRVEAERIRQEERKLRLQEGKSSSTNKVDENAVVDRTNTGKIKGANSCTACGGSYTDAEFRAHFRSDFHRFNLKLKLQGAPCIGEEEFILCDASSFFDMHA